MTAIQKLVYAVLTSSLVSMVARNPASADSLARSISQQVYPLVARALSGLALVAMFLLAFNKILQLLTQLAIDFQGGPIYALILMGLIATLTAFALGAVFSPRFFSLASQKNTASSPKSESIFGGLTQSFSNGFFRGFNQPQP